MNSTYEFCKRMIALGWTEEFQIIMDVFFGMKRLGIEEYTELTALLAAAIPEMPKSGGGARA